MKLADKNCSDGASVPPLKVLRARELLKELGQGWKLNGKGYLERRYTFKDFAQALAFANKGALSRRLRAIILICIWPGESARSRSGRTRLRV